MDEAEGLPLEGLEGLSPEWDGWLAGLRARLGSRPDLMLLPERLQGLSPPHLVLLIAPLGADPQGVARALAERLELPFRLGFGQGRGVFYLGEPFPSLERAPQMAQNPHGVYVLSRSALGEDPPFVLAARVHYPPSRTWVLALEPLSWFEARQTILKSFPFEEAAAYYLNSGGWPLFLRELLALGNPEGLPQRVRAAVFLEAARLCPEERLALEKLSVHPGVLEEGLVRALGVLEQVERLEALHWLVYREGEWVFADEAVRRVFYGALEPGVRRRLHRLAAEWLEAQGRAWAAFYHRLQAGEASPEPPPLSPFLRPLFLPGETLQLDLWPSQRVARKGRAQPELFPYGPGVVLEEQRAAWVQRHGTPTGLAWTLEEPALLELEIQLALRSPLGVGLGGLAWPLVLHAPLGEVYFLPGVGPGQKPGLGVLPLGRGLVRLRLPPGPYRLESRAELALVELGWAFWRAQEGGEEPALDLAVLAPAPSGGRRA
ncbi:hypothetical protein [Thermus sp.]|uniref:hypothetical protein n=1 Tax=Thermus sp. TaxID=275 RepID=UPI00307F105D